MATRGCSTDPNKFCYICGEFTVKKHQRNITEFVKKVYYAYFGVRLGDQDKSWAPRIVCCICVEELKQWLSGKQKSLRFGIPMIWREPTNHSDDCYFCSLNVHGFNAKNRKGIVYPNIPSAMRPVPHGPGIPIPKPPEKLKDISSDSEEEGAGSDDDFNAAGSNDPQLFSQSELNDLVRDLGLPKNSAELLGSRLNEKNLLAPGVSFSWFRRREKDFLPYFSEESNLVYCSNIPGLMAQFQIEYDAQEWRLFIDSCKRSLKAVLLHNGNKYASIPVGHSVHYKECYENLAIILNKLKYKDHMWNTCGDLKVIAMLLGLQCGNTKYPCFLCEWDSRERSQHWIKRKWPVREKLEIGSKNVIAEALVDREKILLPPLHIKLGLIKQFVKALDKEGGCFKHLLHAFPGLSAAKVKEGVFVGPDIRKLMKDENFEACMTKVEKEAWRSFKEVVNKFLGNYKDPNFKKIVKSMLENFKKLGCSVSLKVHFLMCHLDFFPENLGAVSEEHGERFHQDIKQMECRYQGRWNSNMIADYCWSIHREQPQVTHRRSASTRSIQHKRTRYYNALET